MKVKRRQFYQNNQWKKDANKVFKKIISGFLKDNSIKTINGKKMRIRFTKK